MLAWIQYIDAARRGTEPDASSARRAQDDAWADRALISFDDDDDDDDNDSNSNSGNNRNGNARGATQGEPTAALPTESDALIASLPVYSDAAIHWNAVDDLSKSREGVASPEATSNRPDDDHTVLLPVRLGAAHDAAIVNVPVPHDATVERIALAVPIGASDAGCRGGGARADA